jgi:hypothetical protein
MTVTVSKPEFNIRDALTALRRKIGLKGAEVMSANTVDDVYTAIGTNRNLIINGAMSIAQRNTSVSTSSSGYFVADRMYHEFSSGGTWTITKSTDVPSTGEFTSSLKLECTSTASTSGSNYHLLGYKFEGQELQRLVYGKSSAKSMTVSFWVKSTVVGTVSMEFLCRGVSPYRSICRTFTIGQSNVWEKKSVTIPGDSAAEIPNNNQEGMYVFMFLVTGASFTTGGLNTSWNSRDTTKIASNTFNAGTATGNIFAITGLQVEVGEVATPFEHRLYGTELALCKRYYEELVPDGSGADSYIANGMVWTTTQVEAVLYYEVEKRGTPTVSGTTTKFVSMGGGVSQTASPLFDKPTRKSVLLFANSLSGWTVGDTARILNSGGSTKISVSAEL